MALLFRFGLDPGLNGKAPLLVFIMPVMISAWYGGLGPGLLATLMSAILGIFFFVNPRFTLLLPEAGEVLRAGIFLVEGVLISWLSEALRSAKYRAEQVSRSLQESEERYRLMVAGVSDYAIFMLDPNGRVATWNLGAERLSGYRSAEVVGRHVSLFYPSDGETADRLNPQLQLALQHGSIADEGWQQRKNGSRFWAQVSLTALQTDRTLRGFSYIARDLTERKQAEDALRRSAERLAALHQIDRAILTASSLDQPIQIALTFLQQIRYEVGCVALFDFATQQARLWLRSADETTLEHRSAAINAFISGGTMPQSIDRYRQELAAWGCPQILEAFLTGEIVCLRTPLIAKAELIGELTLFLHRSTAISQQQQQVIQEVADQLAIALQQFRFQEQLRNYAAELEQRVADRTAKLQTANEELEAFGYSVSHDLRSPLRTMQGFAQALLEDAGDRLPESGQGYVQQIIQAAVEMEALIADLLTYSQISRTDLDLQPVQLEAVVQAALQELTSIGQDTQADIAIDLPLPDAIAHSPTLKRILINLLSNALKFVEPGHRPQIRIWAEELAEADFSPRVRLWIADSGIGINPKFYERIFRVFERLHGVETYPGTGIGLAIVRKGMERMNGSAGVESQVNQGSRFWIELPKAPPLL